ncbi:MAG TPA: transcription termination/antitermination NusG family protein [Acetobacteraceae bacterium]|jgi:transcriptional antiterminator RfaH
MLDAAHNQDLPATQLDRDTRRCGSYWAVCQTHPQAERWAAANLQRQGYVTFLPLVRVLKRDRSPPTLRHHVLAPLFTSYLFVQVDRHWAPIQHTSGVRRLLMADRSPGMVPEAAVEALRGVQDLEAIPTPWEPGTPCSLVLGPFAGLDAVVLSTHRNIAQVGIMCMGALRSVSVDVACLVSRG